MQLYVAIATGRSCCQVAVKVLVLKNLIESTIQVPGTQSNST